MQESDTHLWGTAACAMCGFVPAGWARSQPGSASLEVPASETDRQPIQFNTQPRLMETTQGKSAFQELNAHT